jgi:hypothetical protein
MQSGLTYRGAKPVYKTGVTLNVLADRLALRFTPQALL